MKKFVFASVTLLVFTLQARSQGCVAIRGGGSSCNVSGQQIEAGSWQFNMGYRYFKSFRHFKGREEQKERLKENTEVINWQHLLDLSVSKQINNRWSLLVGLPIGVNKRSSLYEHGRTERHNTRSFGMGDMRIMAYRWMIDPAKHSKGNFQLGAGLKLPTGDYDYKDFFENVGPNSNGELRPVDQSIQLGDGGTGIAVELNSFYNFSPLAGLYGNFFYLSNPREQNGTRTYRETLSPVLANEAIMSVADQYMARIGFQYNFIGSLKGLSGSVGGRIEGIPVKDILGASNYFRRPGYVVSVEPGLVLQQKKSIFFLTVPVALERNRTRSVTDKAATITSGTYRHGDAAFADYAINLGYSVRF
ncbi:hypothetical protein [Flavihumibacter sp. CACIAM 22H1]|uniref:hypothetical protein n=1 Tax=Flavihumibacter sp. CACIAM 22H1 TaxID=1812911 RepID=UPI0007A82D66|nr:hypothetical protein [Flavihumibacter sp. CACIAM 22H1]KYP15675.1 MAG: hypothetical protein A1D16_19110 [Flavihumibacter sp. CACIAM 22H1]